MTRVDVNPKLLHWACDRSGRSWEYLYRRFPKLEQWETGESKPTFKQLEDFAQATYTPIGYFFLSEPPAEKLPISDLRTLENKRIEHPSPDLLHTLYICQRRQAWYRDYAQSVGQDKLGYIGSLTSDFPPEQAAEQIRQSLDFDLKARQDCRSWSEALRYFIAQAENLGILVMISGVVGNNNNRPLDPEEFRGFALSDDLAPLVFINGKDTKAAQIFTLGHEIAHLWIGESTLSDAGPASWPSDRIENWCNVVAAEFLVPMQELQEAISENESLADEKVDELAQKFKVSTLVVLRRLFDLGYITREEFQEAYPGELSRLKRLSKSGGGNYYLTQEVRASRRFVRALVTSTLEGGTMYRDAFKLLGIKKTQTFSSLSSGIQ